MTLLSSLLFIVGCTTSDKVTPQDPNTQTSDTSQGDSASNQESEIPPALQNNDLGETDLFPEQEEPYRNKKRMRIEHVKDSMTLVSGGIEWVVNNEDKWAYYSATLGVPDFRERIREDRTVSVMFQKFLDDAASHTCEAWMTTEATSTQRLFFAEIEPNEMDLSKIRLNLVALRRRIHNKNTAIDEPIIDSLIDLHHVVVQRTNDPLKAWQTVCIAMFTHPDFYMY